MIDWIMKIIVTRKFSLVWLGILFAVYGGLVYGSQPEIIVPFAIAFVVVAMGGYNLGRIAGWEAREHIVKMLMDANNSLAKALQDVYDKVTQSPPQDEE